MNFVNYQNEVDHWMRMCFGEEILSDRRERNFRFGEEALELLQAAGCSKKDVLDLVEYVYSRPAGDLEQEIGGTMVCLAALCQAQDVNLRSAAWTELTRCWSNIDKIRAKHDAKKLRTPHSALPGESGDYCRSCKSPVQDGHHEECPIWRDE